MFYCLLIEVQCPEGTFWGDVGKREPARPSVKPELLLTNLHFLCPHKHKHRQRLLGVGRVGNALYAGGGIDRQAGRAASSGGLGARQPRALVSRKMPLPRWRFGTNSKSELARGLTAVPAAATTPSPPVSTTPPGRLQTTGPGTIALVHCLSAPEPARPASSAVARRNGPVSPKAA